MGPELKAGKKSLALLAATTAFLFGVNYAIAAAENNPNRTWQTEPHLSFDDWDWVLRRPFMKTEWLARGKLTHDEMWTYWPINPNFEGRIIEGIPGEMVRRSWFDAVRISLGPMVGGWDMVYKVEPENPNVDWKLSWGVPETGWGQELRIVPRKEIPLLLLAGPGSYKIFGFDRYNRSREVKLKINGPYWRYDPTLEGDPV